MAARRKNRYGVYGKQDEASARDRRAYDVRKRIKNYDSRGEEVINKRTLNKRSKRR